MTEIDKKLESLLEDLCNRAYKLGASEALAIKTSDIVLDDRVALKCLVPMCANYNVNLTCPPNIIPITKFKRILKKYRSAILIKISNNLSEKPEVITSQYDLSKVWEIFSNANKGEESNGPINNYVMAFRQSQERLYSIIEKIESICLNSGYNFTAGLAAGGCSLCDSCVGIHSGLPCRHPFRARPSMESLGIDVVATTKRAGIQLQFNQETSNWIGLILID